MLACAVSVLPELETTPRVQTLEADSVLITCKAWDETMAGTGPVAAYVIQYQKWGDSEWTDGVKTSQVTNSILRATQTGLEPGSTYLFRVVPVLIGEQAIRGIPSEVQVATTPNMLKGKTTQP